MYRTLSIGLATHSNFLYHFTISFVTRERGKIEHLWQAKPCAGHTGRVTKDHGRQPQLVDSEGLGVATSDPSLTQNSNSQAWIRRANVIDDMTELA